MPAEAARLVPVGSCVPYLSLRQVRRVSPRFLRLPLREAAAGKVR
jgi:hypothetical protein